MADKNQTLHTPMQRLPRAAERAVHAWGAHRDADPVLDAQGATLAAAAEAFHRCKELYLSRHGEADEARRQQLAAKKQLRQTETRCLAALRSEHPEAIPADRSDSATVEDAVARCRALASHLGVVVRGASAPPFAAQLVKTLTDAVDAAEAATRATYAAESLEEDARLERRRAAVELDNKLIGFRAILRSVLGRTHTDYQKLRVKRSHEAELEVRESLLASDGDPAEVGAHQAAAAT